MTSAVDIARRLIPSSSSWGFSVGVMPTAARETMFVEAMRAYAPAGKPANAETKFHDGGHKVDDEAAFERLNQRLNSGSTVPARPSHYPPSSRTFP